MILKSLIFLTVIVLFLAVPTSHADQVKDESGSTYEESSSHNPLTGTTTNKKMRRDKRKYKKNDQTYTSEEEIIEKKKVSDDGNKIETQRVEKVTEEKN